MLVYTLMCILHNYSSIKARFSHTSTVTRLLSCSGKKNTRTLACILFLYRNQYFLTFLRQNTQERVLVFHSVLQRACPQPCSKRADMLYYYFHKKEEHFKMFFKTNAAHGEAMRIARGVRGHGPPRNFFKTVQFGAF